MQIISKLSDECEKCSQVNDCDKKRMVACKMKGKEFNTANATTLATMPLSQPMAKIINPITINMGGYGRIDTSLEEIKEKLKKDFYKELNCPFNR